MLPKILISRFSSLLDVNFCGDQVPPKRYSSKRSFWCLIGGKPKPDDQLMRKTGNGRVKWGGGGGGRGRFHSS